MATSSLDKTVKIWDMRQGNCMVTLQDHSDEILDICFNPTGSLLASASGDATARIYNMQDFQTQANLIGHSMAISKIMFNPQG